MNIRVIDTGAADGFYNMAVDEALLQRCRESPALRFYTFSPPAITIGRFQKFNATPHELPIPKIDIVRRITGGRAVFHQGDLTYSLVVRWPTDNSFFGRNVFEGYKKMSYIFQKALGMLNIEAELVRVKRSLYKRNLGCFSSVARYELQVNHRKILGSAQRIKEGVILQQGSFLLNSKFQNSKWHQIGLREIVGCEVKKEEIIGAVKESIKSMGIKIIEGVLTSEEKELVNKLIPKYQKIS